MSGRLLHFSELETEVYERLIALEDELEELKQRMSCLETHLAEQDEREGALR